MISERKTRNTDSENRDAMSSATAPSVNVHSRRSRGLQAPEYTITDKEREFRPKKRRKRAFRLTHVKNEKAKKAQVRAIAAIERHHLPESRLSSPRSRIVPPDHPALPTNTDVSFRRLTRTAARELEQAKAARNANAGARNRASNSKTKIPSNATAGIKRSKRKRIRDSDEDDVTAIDVTPGPSQKSHRKRRKIDRANEEELLLPPESMPPAMNTRSRKARVADANVPTQGRGRKRRLDLPSSQDPIQGKRKKTKFPLALQPEDGRVATSSKITLDQMETRQSSQDEIVAVQLGSSPSKQASIGSLDGFDDVADTTGETKFDRRGGETVVQEPLDSAIERPISAADVMLERTGYEPALGAGPSHEIAKRLTSLDALQQYLETHFESGSMPVHLQTLIQIYREREHDGLHQPTPLRYDSSRCSPITTPQNDNVSNEMSDALPSGKSDRPGGRLHSLKDIVPNLDSVPKYIRQYLVNMFYDRPLDTPGPEFRPVTTLPEVHIHSASLPFNRLRRHDTTVLDDKVYQKPLG